MHFSFHDKNACGGERAFLFNGSCMPQWSMKLDLVGTIAVVVLFVGLLAVCGSSQEAPSPDKSNYWLFKPVPERMMRELSPDRPDKTETPYTLDAGHLSVEMDFANYTYDRSDNITSKAWNVAPFNFKVGLFNRVDVQFVFDDYEHVNSEDRSSGASAVQSGIGDFTGRVVMNVWGDDGGRTALAVLPYVKIPTNTAGLGNRSVEGGLIVPFALKLPADLDMGFETAVGFLHDNGDGNYHDNFINSITFDHPIVGKVSGYLEFFSDISTERHAGWIGTVDAGLEFLVAENVQFDCGCNFGITPAADDFNPFAGVTVRF
jgi:Putative MetA-pathway of phenol degradation